MNRTSNHQKGLVNLTSNHQKGLMNRTCNHQKGEALENVNTLKVPVRNQAMKTGNSLLQNPIKSSLVIEKVELASKGVKDLCHMLVNMYVNVQVYSLCLKHLYV